MLKRDFRAFLGGFLLTSIILLTSIWQEASAPALVHFSQSPTAGLAQP